VRLTTQKRSLDALYQRSHQILGLGAPDFGGRRQGRPIDFDSAYFEQQESRHRHSPAIVEGQVPTPVGNNQEPQRIPRPDAKSRFRKQRPPQAIDLEALQYTRADDPLPAETTALVSDDDDEERATPQQQRPADNKLKGLGPYGTHYTHHFEVFPLDAGTYFHESTLIGRGAVRKATEIGFSDRIRNRPKPTVSYVLDGQPLRWGEWDDQTSSEFGILVDWIAEKLASGSDEDAGGGNIISAADFVLDYVLEALSVQDDEVEKAFVSRFLEVVSSFLGRFEKNQDWLKTTRRVKEAHIEVADRLGVALLPVYSLTQSPGADMLQGMAVETLLKKVVLVAIKGLLDFGFEDVRTLYGDLQRLSVRERGIRPRQVLANGWVVVMRVLESANIPRSSFWDVTHSAMLDPKILSGLDAQAFERLWHDTLTLLPLGEMDNNGILVPGLRHIQPLEGWGLPQRLLKHVFELYKANPQQSPSFNGYCRALVARCHFLVQQWGWRKCSGVIGTIFDFFGSQNLAHLRNEEVYKSPRFLEELHGNPSLAVEPEDRCFHIFIKLVALAIQRLRELGRTNDIRNLVARTLPNHNRQYLKEDTIHQHDLAALRNHHDLLCALFWAAPPEQRPGVHLIEKLVVPGSAHKEACLINIRAWNQLARFIVAKGEGRATFRPFAVWRSHVFDQLLDQYQSAASDIEQQFTALQKTMVGISVKVRDEMIARNKATAVDVLHFSVKASLDVLKHASGHSLEAIMYALNHAQLQKVFTSLDFRSPGFDWSVLRVALETLEHFLGQIEKLSEEQYSSTDDLEKVDTDQLDDAIFLVQEQLSKDFFWMARNTLKLPQSGNKKSLNSGKLTDQAICAEKTVTLSARIAIQFIRMGSTQLSAYFTSGSRYCLFSDLPRNMGGSAPVPGHPDLRRYLPLFIAVLVKNHVFNFKDIGINLLGLWVLSIVKPARFLGYESYLADVLRRHNFPFIQENGSPTTNISAVPGVGTGAAVGLADNNYNSNRDFFAYAIHHMRKSLIREPSSTAGSSSTQPTMTQQQPSSSTQSIKMLREEHAKTLQLAMSKMKEDLILLRSHPLSPQDANNREHQEYISFVRQIISLIRSHGVGICVVDPFFTTPSMDYSPPLQDPQLHTAGIVAYGVRLGERDFTTAVPQLFHYLFNNFKIALGSSSGGNMTTTGGGGDNNNKLETECEILSRAMAANEHVVRFMVEFMLPAIIYASSAGMAAARSSSKGVWILLDVYVRALGGVLTGETLPREFLDDEDVGHLAGLLEGITAWLEGLRKSCGGGDDDDDSFLLSPERLRVMVLLADVANMIQPSLKTWLWMGKNVNGGVVKEEDDDAAAAAAAAKIKSALYQRVESAVDALASFYVAARRGVDGAQLVAQTGEVRVGQGFFDGLPSLPVPASSGPAGSLAAITSSSAAIRASFTPSHRVQEFAKVIVTDVRNNWIVAADGTVSLRMVRGPGGGGAGGLPNSTQALRGAQPTPGVENPNQGGTGGSSGFRLGSTMELLGRWYVLTGQWALGKAYLGAYRRDGKRRADRWDHGCRPKAYDEDNDGVLF